MLSRKIMFKKQKHCLTLWLPLWDDPLALSWCLLLLLPLGPPPPSLPLPFSTSHSLCPNGGLPRAARAPCSSNLLREKSKLKEFRLVRRIFVFFWCCFFFSQAISDLTTRKATTTRDHNTLLLYYERIEAFLTLTGFRLENNFHLCTYQPGKHRTTLRRRRSTNDSTKKKHTSVPRSIIHGTAGWFERLASQ